MSRLLIGNFDFEWSLAHNIQHPSAALQRLSAELATTWLAVSEPGDILLLPGETEPGFWTQLGDDLPWPLPGRIRCLSEAPSGLTVTPWGWTQQFIDACRTNGVPLPPYPDVEVVRRVNSRRFSHELERDLACGLRGAAWLSELDFDWLASQPRWVIKADLSNSSRERLLGGGPLSPRDRTWLETRLRRDGGVAFEPWVEIVEEAGLQWDIPGTGEPQLIGITPLLTDAHGRYRGSVFSHPTADADWTDGILTSREAARRIQAAGYFGPLGIDACRYRDSDGVLRLRPLMDINARWTMGRLSLGWRRLLAPGQHGLWRHGPPDATLRRPPPLVQGQPLYVIPTSPQLLDGSPTRIRHRVEIYAGT
jgi:hypothetical protein